MINYPLSVIWICGWFPGTNHQWTKTFAFTIVYYFFFGLFSQKVNLSTSPSKIEFYEKIYIKFLFSSLNGSKESAAPWETKTPVISAPGPQSFICAATGEISTRKAKGYKQLLRDKVV